MLFELLSIFIDISVESLVDDVSTSKKMFSLLKLKYPWFCKISVILIRSKSNFSAFNKSPLFKSIFLSFLIFLFISSLLIFG